MGHQQRPQCRSILCVRIRCNFSQFIFIDDTAASAFIWSIENIRFYIVHKQYNFKRFYICSGSNKRYRDCNLNSLSVRKSRIRAFESPAEYVIFVQIYPEPHHFLNLSAKTSLQHSQSLLRDYRPWQNQSFRNVLPYFISIRNKSCI